MHGRTLMTVIMILALSTVAQAEDEKKVSARFEDQPTGIKRLFEQQAPNWGKIGDKLWCIEVMKEAEKRAKRGQGDAYNDVSAPWFYEPISDTRCRWIGEVYMLMKLEAPEGYEVLEGQAGKVKDGRFYFLPRLKSKNLLIFAGHVWLDVIANTAFVVINNKNVDTTEITSAVGSKFTVDVYHQAKLTDLTKPVKADELFNFFLANNIKQFPVWRAKLNKERDGFEWTNYSRNFNLPN